MQQSINDLYTQFVNGVIERTEFEGLVFQKLVKNQTKYNFGHWNRDEYEDFISWFYPRLHNVIDTYRETGASFEVYIGSVIRLSAREYRMRVTNNNITEYAAWSVRVPELYAHEEPPAYMRDDEANEEAEIAASQIAVIHNKGRKNPRQILALILKCYYYVSDDFLDKIAPIAGIDRENLKQMIDKLRTVRLRRDNEIFSMRERIYCQFYRCIIYEKRLSLMPENSPAAVKMKLRLEKARRRLETMRKRLSGIRSDPTNRQVAEVIGISKGAVDASLYSLKARWTDRTDKPVLN
ncbi:MAG: hypothetical protein LBG91_00720 [Treponema sp.]|jgi:hypothetical protein|nr:hypothetical protein [Treponema sp.]